MIARRRGARAAVLAAVVSGALLLAGCNLDPRTATLPGGVATGSDGYTVRLQLRSADNLVPNAEVQYENVRIGTVRRIELDHKTWNAVVVISLKKDVVLPANIGAALGQKSLLGAEYVQMIAPATPVGTHLADGAVIPVSRTQHYPETEEVLAAVSDLLNGGGLQQLKTITSELNKALAGRTGTARDVLSRVADFAGRLNAQKQLLLDATQPLDDLAGQLAANRDTVAKALTHITPAIATLNKDKYKLTDALAALNKLSRTASDVLDQTKGKLESNLSLLRPTLTKLVQAGSSLPKSLVILVSFPFSLTIIDKAIKGDYMNLFEKLDISLDALTSDFLGSLLRKGKLIPISTIGQVTDPILGPVHRGKGSGSGSGGGTTSPTAPPTGGSGGGSSSPPPPSSPSPSPSPSSCGLLDPVLGGC